MVDVKSIEDHYVEKELAVLRELEVSERLRRCFCQKDGLKLFAERFYHVRAHFVKLNFLIGSRCPTHERYWGGLARNLSEELGGGETAPHNELYRRFLLAVGAKSERKISEPRYATQFNLKWERFAVESPLLDAISAIAIYEVFDQPDYRLLYDLVSEFLKDPMSLEFFAVHAGAAHFELFDKFLNEEDPTALLEALERGGTFVLNQQTEMWRGLLINLESELEITSSHRSSELLN